MAGENHTPRPSMSGKAPILRTIHHVHIADIHAGFVGDGVNPDGTCWLEIPFGDGVQRVVAYFPDPEALGRLIADLHGCWQRWHEALALPEAR